MSPNMVPSTVTQRLRRVRILLPISASGKTKDEWVGGWMDGWWDKFFGVWLQEGTAWSLTCFILVVMENI